MNREEIPALRKRALESYYKKMNEAQAQAVFCVKGPLLVLAGAGSGKTTVIVNRLEYLLRFGNAYHSDVFEYEPDDDAVEYMKNFADGKVGYNENFEKYLRLEPVKPWHALAITFTNKAAGELKERLEKKLGETARDVWAGTFHSSCVRILRAHADVLGYSRNFTIYDTDDSKRVMKETQKLLAIEDKMLSHKAILSVISRAKDYLQTPDEFLTQNYNDFRMRRIGEAYEKYQALLKSADAMDFDDLIFNAVKLLESNPEILNKYSDKFSYVMVDEFQDTNYAQYRLVSLLASKYMNLCVVGDDDQSIYRFRGATIENILGFEKQFPNAKVIKLEKNYRSTKNILDAANHVIANNEGRKGKSLWTDNPVGDKVLFYSAIDEQSEARFISEEITKNVADGTPFNSHTILYRMNAQSNTIENALVRAGIPYRVVGGHRFYERKEIKDSIAYLSVVTNPADSVRLRRIINEPKRGIGDVTVANAAEIADALGISLFEVLKSADRYPALNRASRKLIEFSELIEYFISAAEELPLSALFDLIIKKTGYLDLLRSDPLTFDERSANLAELANNLDRYSEENPQGDLSGFLEEVALITDIDNYNSEVDAVTLMTIHSAKGLEFPIVFIVGMEEGIFPSYQSMYSPAEIEEERRLAYVAITRAMQRLYLTNAKTRMLYGSTSRNPTSRFIEEIPDSLLEMRSDYTNLFKTLIELDSPAKQPSSQRSKISDNAAATTPPPVTLKVGDTVKHAVFGQGILLSIQPVGNDSLLEVAFEEKGTKKLMANYAKLHKVP